MEEYFIFYHEPGEAFWRVMLRLSPWGPAETAHEFLHDYKVLLETGQIPAVQVPDMVAVRGSWQN